MAGPQGESKPCEQACATQLPALLCCGQCTYSSGSCVLDAFYQYHARHRFLRGRTTHLTQTEAHRCREQRQVQDASTATRALLLACWLERKCTHSKVCGDGASMNAHSHRCDLELFAGDIIDLGFKPPDWLVLANNHYVLCIHCNPM